MESSSIPTVHPSYGFRIAAFSGLAGLIGFLAWCTVDSLYVHAEGWHTHDNEPVMFLTFIGGSAIGSFAGLSPATTKKRLWLAGLTTVVGAVLAIILILTFGMKFHFAIGGQL